MSEFGLMPGEYPAVVDSYDKNKRIVRVRIPGITDGADVFPAAEIRYAIGDKSKSGALSTEVEILAGDTIWVAFIGGDPRYPLITGYRNPEAGNGVDWRRWHHKNMELLADVLMRVIAGGNITIQSTGATITIQAAANVNIVATTEVTVTAPTTRVNGNLVVAGTISTTGAGGSITASGNVEVNGNIHATGTIIDDSGNTSNHSH